jgi:hypothetical protein
MNNTNKRRRKTQVETLNNNIVYSEAEAEGVRSSPRQVKLKFKFRDFKPRSTFTINILLCYELYLEKKGKQMQNMQLNMCVI